MKVLVVDDDPHIRELIEMKLRGAGHDVITAVDGEQGLSKALSEQPNLVLLDVMMPKMTGIEVCQAIRQDANMGTVPIVLITARSAEADVESGFLAGADDYITKPFSPRELLSRLEAVLSPP